MKKIENKVFACLCDIKNWKRKKVAIDIALAHLTKRNVTLKWDKLLSKVWTWLKNLIVKSYSKDSDW